jgi:hypothetical protein
MLPSRIDSAPLLPALADLSAEDLSGIEQAEVAAGGEFSAARFFERAPILYQAVARGIAEGLSDAALARMFRAHDRTIAAIRAREVGSMSAEQYRRSQGARLRGVVVRAVDEIGRRIAEEPGEIAFKDLVTAADKLGSHERLLAGEPTEIHGELSSAGASEDIRAALAGAMAGNPFGRRESRPEIPPAEAVEAVQVGALAVDPEQVEAVESRAHVEEVGEVREAQH